MVPGETPTAVYDEAVAWAQQFAGAATYALRAAKEAVDRGLEVDLESGLEIERAQFAALFATADRAAGMQSFIESGPGKARFEGSEVRRFTIDGGCRICPSLVQLPTPHPVAPVNLELQDHVRRQDLL